jgi:CRP-like cAMP-binding protein
MSANKNLSTFESVGQVRIYKKGENIYSPGDEVKEIFFIKSGSVKTGCYLESGREITKFVFYSEEVFGESALVGLKKRRDYAFALENTEILIINLQGIVSRIKKDAHLAWIFINLMGGRNIAYDERLESMVFKDSKTRILDFIVDTIEKNGKKIGFEIVVNKFFTHQEIANLTSTSRQTVTTILNILKNHNVITFDRRRLLVRDFQKLKDGIC